MNWIDRFSFVMRSTVTTIREKVEDPERMLHQLVCDMEEELETVRASVAGAIADERQLAKEVESLRTECRNWEDRSAAALRRSDESAARLALEQRLRCQERLAQIEKSREQQRSQTEKLRELSATWRTRFSRPASGGRCWLPGWRVLIPRGRFGEPWIARMGNPPSRSSAGSRKKSSGPRRWRSPTTSWRVAIRMPRRWLCDLRGRSDGRNWNWSSPN